MLNSCGQCDHCVQSGSGGILFYNFLPAEMASISIREYVSVPGFSQTDSIGYVPQPYNGDSSVYYVGGLNTMPSSGLAYILVYIPADSLSYKITGFTYDTVACSQCPNIKLNYLTSCYVNGLKDSVTNTDGNTGYIKLTK